MAEKAARFDPNTVIKEVRNVGKKIDTLSAKIDKLEKAKTVGWFDSDSYKATKELSDKFDKYVVESNKGDKKIMGAVEELQAAVVQLGDDAVASADTVSTAVDLLKQLVAAGVPKDDPLIIEATDKLEAAHEAFKASTQKLRDQLAQINVSGGVVQPPSA
jgi:hypothetical protein